MAALPAINPAPVPRLAADGMALWWHAWLQLAVKRAEEAEEEQCRTEEEAAQCRSELAALREGSPAAHPGGGFDEAELRRELDSERSHVASLMAALRQAKVRQPPPPACCMQEYRWVI